MDKQQAATVASKKSYQKYPKPERKVDRILRKFLQQCAIDDEKTKNDPRIPIEEFEEKGNNYVQPEWFVDRSCEEHHVKFPGEFPSERCYSNTKCFVYFRKLHTGMYMDSKGLLHWNKDRFCF